MTGQSTFTKFLVHQTSVQWPNKINSKRGGGCQNDVKGNINKVFMKDKHLLNKLHYKS